MEKKLLDGTLDDKKIEIADKHVEIIAKRMISKIKIVNSGDSLYLPGTMVNINKFADINKDGKDILLNRKIQQDDFRAFIPEKEIVRYSLSYFSIREARNNEIVFEISFCVPDTDVCYWFELIVSDNGDVKINEIIVEESDM
jgi:hypothetical protein